MVLTYKKKIDVVTDNAIVLKICGKLAEHVAVPYSRVTDAYGGYSGAPSASLPAAAAVAKTTTTTNTTANKTRMLNTTANKTTTPTDYKVNIFVQPDPFAKKADNDATVKSVTGTTALAAIDTITKATYGVMTATAATTTEAAVKWTKKPAATGGAKQITITATTDVGGYVYCAVAKSASRRRMLNTTNASNTTTAATTTTTTAEVTDL